MKLLEIGGKDAGDASVKKRLKLVRTIVSAIIWLALTRFCVYSALHADTMVYFASGTWVAIAFFILPYLILGGLYGYLMAMISFMISFVCTMIFDMDSAYKMAIYLAPALCFSLFSQHFWFMDKKRTALACLITLASTSVLELACLSIIKEGEYDLQNIVSQVINLGIYFIRDALVIFVCGFATHFFVTKAPDICKTPFPIAVVYTKAYQENKDLRRDLRKTRVNTKITAIIIGVEVILGVSVSVFMMALFPDLKGVFIEGMGQRVNPQVVAERHSENSEGLISDEEFTSRMEQINFTFNAKTINYDIKMLLMMLCVGVPMAAIANIYIKLSIGMPLGMMSDFMEEYASADDDKKLEVGRKVDRLKVRSKDEIRIVSDSIKSTVHSIEDYIGRLKEEQELEKELEVAQKASEAKSSFLSNMSHEIRTPINAVLGMNEMILRESSDAQIQEYAQNVKSAGNSLLGIVNDILDFSKIEAGKMDILPVEYHLSSMINDLINMISVKAKDKGLELKVNVDEKIPDKLIGDEVRVKQCVTNVLTNAVKYTEEGSVTMDVGFEKLDDESITLKFRVVDTGIGIKEEDINKLFSPFERIEEIRNRTIEGTGLGMSIVKKLLAMMDTKLEVKSVYGEGSDFSFGVKQKVAVWEEIGDFKEKYKQFVSSLEKYHEKFRAPEAEILVVDDTVINLTVVKGLLKSTLIKVDTAESGRETLDKVVRKKYDAIFIDHRMPEMDGVETLEAMKVLEGNLNVGVPCIALTANAGAGARDEYLAAGFDDYLSKPVNGELLEEMLRQYLPKEKVLEADEVSGDLAGGSGFVGAGTGDGFGGSGMAVAGVDGSGFAGVSAEARGGEDDFLEKIQGIDLSEAEKNCGSREILRDVVKEFLLTIDAKADNIEKFANEKDYRNYTVAVHALKSSARLLGAMKLSEDAAYLEQCGNEEDAEEIELKTPDLLKLYRSYKDKLFAARERVPDDDLPEISAEELMGAFSDMKELLEAYDFDTADGIMDMLSEYRVPAEYRQKYDRIKELMAEVDRDGLLDIL